MLIHFSILILYHGVVISSAYTVIFSAKGRDKKKTLELGLWLNPPLKFGLITGNDSLRMPSSLVYFNPPSWRLFQVLSCFLGWSFGLVLSGFLYFCGY